MPGLEVSKKHTDPASKNRVPATITQRKLHAAHWLCMLHQLPDPLYREVVRRFAYGETAKDVATYILTQKDRGGCQHLSFDSLRQYLQVLRQKVSEIDEESGKARLKKIHKMAKDIQKEEIGLANVASIRAAANRAADAADCDTPVPSNDPEPVVRELAEIEQELKRIITTLSAREEIAFNLALTELRIDAAWALELELKVPLPDLTRIQRLFLESCRQLIECDRTELAVLKRKAKMRLKARKAK